MCTAETIRCVPPKRVPTPEIFTYSPASSSGSPWATALPWTRSWPRRSAAAFARASASAAVDTCVVARSTSLPETAPLTLASCTVVDAFGVPVFAIAAFFLTSQPRTLTFAAWPSALTRGRKRCSVSP